MLQEIHIFCGCHTKVLKASITFDHETWHQACLVFMLLAFNPFQVNILLMKKSGTWFLQAKSMKNNNGRVAF